MQRKILLFANTDWYLFNFRLHLAERLRAEGWHVTLVSPPGEYGPRLQGRGFRWLPLPFSSRSTNPWHELGLLLALIKLYRRERPDIVHQFTIKCVLYGSLAAKLVGGIRVVNAVTGLGHIFTDLGFKAALLKPPVKFLYRLALGGKEVRTIFQNSEDRQDFIDWGLVEGSTSVLIRGSGVDVSKFKKAAKPDGPDENYHVTLLFASRLLREKGLFELFEAYSILRDRNPEIELLVAGDLYPGNPSSLTESDLESMRGRGIRYLGHVEDMVALLSQTDIVVLPSYREGTPRILIEAAAMEVPIVATDIAGCRGLVRDGVNGLLVPVKNVDRLTAALEKLITDQDLRRRMGGAGRQIVLTEFDQACVNGKTINVFHELLK